MGLTRGQILRLVNDYIGVSNGYLGLPDTLRFTYRSHKEFYPMYCELEIDPSSMEGTTRERFISILFNANPKEQAKIIRGIFKRFPADCTLDVFNNQIINEEYFIELDRRENLKNEYLKVAEELERNSLYIITDIVDSKTCLEALRDAQILLKERGAQSAIDRVHTTLHAFLIAICKKAKLAFNKDDSITKLFKIINENHYSFQNTQKTTRCIANLINDFNPIRNRESLAHPNEELISEEDAQFVIDLTVACIKYISSLIK